MEYQTTTSTGKPVTIRKEPDDPLCLRVSLGGKKEDGYYLVFRGDINKVEEMINETQELFSKAKEHFLSQNN